MRNPVLIALGFAIATSDAQLVAYHQFATGGSNLNQTKPNIRIENQGTSLVDLSKLTIDYLVYEEGVNPASLVADCWYSSATTCSDVTAEFAAIPLKQEGDKKANLRIRLGFRTGLLAGGQNLTLQWGLHEQGYQHRFGESDDWSFTIADGQWHADSRIGINVGGANPDAPSMVWKGQADQLPDPISYNAGDVVRDRATGSSYILDKGAWVILAEVGKVGPQGAQGPKGDAGAMGPQGPEGAVGPMGPAGPQGAMGMQGPAGEAGAVGPAGPKGDDGAAGPQGLMGPQGLKGDKGDAGALDPAALARIEALEALVAKLSTGTIVNEKSLTDGRDGKVYRIVRIGNQNWMAENLNYGGENNALGKCPQNEVAKCVRWGRFYQWSTAMGIDATYNSSKWEGSVENHRGICPAGWHIPNDIEWAQLVEEAENASNSVDAATALKATWGWRTSDRAGTDLLGFSAIGAELPNLDGGDFASFWSANTYAPHEDFQANILSISSLAHPYFQAKRDYISVRCVQDIIR